ncbi:omega-amidase NIT2-like isoform X2 [Centruroides sculpturatus]|uniref:omega-amidase NIT2-like isoform X2 n=1 Tax=Centruroides sculpturatus TaxID=218467 RepID=UPI000C6CE953|nr:omega-amidase NIT2-like isoform X2 [Centruroides sculpturatus]
MASRKLSIALIQMAVTASKEANLEKASELIAKAAGEGAKLVCLPEFFNSPYDLRHLDVYAEKIPGQTSTVLSNAAKNNNIYLIGGMFCNLYIKNFITQFCIYQCFNIEIVFFQFMFDKHLKVIQLEYREIVNFCFSKIELSYEKTSVDN